MSATLSATWLVGPLTRGWRLFERQAIEISAQSGRMVGFDKENCRGSYIVRLGGGKVRYGSLADNRARIGDVCFTP